MKWINDRDAALSRRPRPEKDTIGPVWKRTLGAMALVLALVGCGRNPEQAAKGPFVVVLGVAQDGGFPQAGCRKECCARAWTRPDLRRWVASLAIVDPATSNRWIVDLTPDFPGQLHWLDENHPVPEPPGISGVFLTHAHIGHYLGLVHLGREVMGAHEVPIHVMPRMGQFLAGSGPWEQLFRIGNAVPHVMQAGVPVPLTSQIRVTPVPVPHRDEYSETVGFRIEGPTYSVLYVPDIDKWDRWDVALEDLLDQNDLAYLDGTFYGEGELPGRDMSEIPHPFMVETVSRLAHLPLQQRRKVRFIHLNHTNPAHDPTSAAYRSLTAAGFRVAEQGELHPL